MAAPGPYNCGTPSSARNWDRESLSALIHRYGIELFRADCGPTGRSAVAFEELRRWAGVSRACGTREETMLGWLQRLPRDAWRDALRLGAQSSAAAPLAYLVTEWLELEHFLVIMMAVTALKRSIGGTMGQSLVRFESAVVGSVLGFLAVLVVPPAWGDRTGGRYRALCRRAGFGAAGVLGTCGGPSRRDVAGQPAGAL